MGVVTPLCCSAITAAMAFYRVGNRRRCASAFLTMVVAPVRALAALGLYLAIYVVLSAAGYWLAQAVLLEASLLSPSVSRRPGGACT
jgi:hypothetical protein